MSTDTPIAGDWWCPSCKVALDGSRVTYDERCDTCGTPVSVAGEGDIVRLERENARLREEVETLNVRHAAAMLHAQTHADEYNDLREELTTRERLYKEQWQRAEQAEARALEYKTEHAALLGTSQWQETEIADLRDDVKRLMQTVSECEERALANEKAIDALHIAICQASLALSNGELPYDANAILRQALVDYADAAIGAKNG